MRGQPQTDHAHGTEECVGGSEAPSNAGAFAEILRGRPADTCGQIADLRAVPLDADLILRSTSMCHNMRPAKASNSLCARLGV